MAKLERSLHKQPNKEILEHQWKRKIELRCLELREEMEDKRYVIMRGRKHVTIHKPCPNCTKHWLCSDLGQIQA